MMTEKGLNYSKRYARLLFKITGLNITVCINPFDSVSLLGSAALPMAKTYKPNIKKLDTFICSLRAIIQILLAVSGLFD